MPILKAFFDESMTHATASHRFLFVGGCTMETDDWHRLEKSWQETLQRYNVEMWRSSDCNAAKRQFAGWPDDRRVGLRSALIEVIRSIEQQHIVWHGSDCGVFETVSRDYPNVQLSQYEFSLQQCVDSCELGVANTMLKYSLDICIEQGQGVRHHIRSKLVGIEKSSARINRIQFVEKKAAMALQVADLIAYEACKSHSEEWREPLLALARDARVTPLFSDEEDIRRLFEDRSETQT